MENELINNEPAPTVEKVSVKDLKNEKSKIELEQNTPVNNFVKAAMALSDEDLDKAIAFVNKKLEILKNKK